MPTIIWTDAHSIVALVDSTVVGEGAKATERLISLGTVFDGLIFEFAMCDDKIENRIDVKATAVVLAKNGHELKLMNNGVSRQTSGTASQQKTECHAARKRDLCDGHTGPTAPDLIPPGKQQRIGQRC